VRAALVEVGGVTVVAMGAVVAWVVISVSKRKKADQKLGFGSGLGVGGCF